MATRYDVYVSCEPQDDADGWVAALIAALQNQHRAIADSGVTVFRPTNDDDAQARDALKNARTLLAIVSPGYFANEARRCEWACFAQSEAARNAVGDSTVVVYAATVTELDANAPGDWFDEVRARWTLDLRAWREDGPEAFAGSGIAPWVQRLDQEIDDRLQKAVRREAGRSSIPRHNAQFVGRQKIFKALRASLNDGRPQAVTAVCGLAGAGKTAVALEYAHVYGEDYLGGRFLLPCTGVRDLGGALIGLADQLSVALTDDERRTPSAALARVADELAHGAQRLLILDNVDRPELLSVASRSAWLAPGAHVHVLVSTRLGAEALPDVDTIVLPPLEPAEAVSLFERWQPLRGDRERASAAEIARLLGGHALAVQAAAVYLSRRPSLRVAAYLDRMRAQQQSDVVGADPTFAETLKTLGDLLGPTLDDLTPAQSLALEHAAFMSPDRVGLPWLQQLVGVKFPEMVAPVAPGQPDPWLQAVRGLMALQLLAPSDQPEVGRVHRVVQALVRDRLGKNSQRVLDERRNETLEFVHSQAVWLWDHWVDPSARWAIAPVASLARLLLTQGDVERGVDLANCAFSPYDQLGQFTTARDLLALALEAQEAVGIQRQLRYATTASNLAGVEQDLGLLESAHELFSRALPILERNADDNGGELVAVYNNLGGLEGAMGHSELASGWMRKAVDLAERIYPPDHPELITSYSNLACVETGLGRLQSAVDLLTRVVDIAGRVYGPEHPYTAIFLSNLAAAETQLGRNEEAIDHLRRALTIGEKVYPPEHPQLGVYLRGMAGAELALHRWDEAAAHAERSLAILAPRCAPDAEQILTSRFTAAQIAYERPETASEARLDALAVVRDVYARLCAGKQAGLALTKRIAEWLGGVDARSQSDNA